MPQHDPFTIDIPFHSLRVAKKKSALGTERPIRVAKTLVLAYEMQKLIDEGAVENRAEIASLTKFDGSRISQIMNLIWLAPDIQEEILFMVNRKGYDRITGRALLPIARLISWEDQRRAWKELLRSVANER